MHCNRGRSRPAYTYRLIKALAACLHPRPLRRHAPAMAPLPQCRSPVTPRRKPRHARPTLACTHALMASYALGVACPRAVPAHHELPAAPRLRPPRPRPGASRLCGRQRAGVGAGKRDGGERDCIQCVSAPLRTCVCLKAVVCMCRVDTSTRHKKPLRKRGRQRTGNGCNTAQPPHAARTETLERPSCPSPRKTPPSRRPHPRPLGTLAPQTPPYS